MCNKALKKIQFNVIIKPATENNSLFSLLLLKFKKKKKTYVNKSIKKKLSKCEKEINFC